VLALIDARHVSDRFGSGCQEIRPPYGKL